MFIHIETHSYHFFLWSRHSFFVFSHFCFFLTLVVLGEKKLLQLSVWQSVLLSCCLVKKILNLPPSILHHRICGDLKCNNSNPGIRHPSIRGSFMDDGRRRSVFWPGLAVTIPRSLGPGFFRGFFWPKRQWPYHSLTDRVFFYPFFDLGRQWPYHGPILWDRGMVIDVPV